jgi:hypothetical protein
MVDKIVKFLLLVTPIAYGVNINLDYFSMRFFQIGVMALFCASLFDTPKREIGNIKIPIILLFVLLLFNSFWHRFQPLDTRSLEDVFFAVLAFVIIVRYLSNTKGCFKYILWAAIINIVVMIMQKIGYSPIVSFSHPGAYINCEGGIMGSSSRLAMYITIVLPFIWQISIGAFIALVLTILICGEHNVLYALGVFLIFKAKGKMRIATTILTIGIFYFYRQHYVQSILFRWNNVWKETLDMIFKQPLLGYGYGNYSLFTAKESFSSYLPFIYGTGILGVVWIGYVLRGYFKNFDYSAECLAVLVFLILGITEYPLEIPRLWFTIITIMAFFAIHRRKVSCA